MAASNYADLLYHVGHSVVVCQYTDETNIAVNVAIECNDCSEVLLDYDRETQH